MSKKLKRAVIKEELVALTGDFKKAVLLNQLIYWSERVGDYDQFIEEEKNRAKMAMNEEERKRGELYKQIELTHGWIYKTADDMSAETMLGMSKSSIGRHLETLLQEGWLERRKNPNWKGDNTYQYRVDILKIQKDLFKLGYFLEGYKFDLREFQNEISEFYNETPRFQNKIDDSKIEQPIPKSNNQFQNETTLPEITSEITSKITSENSISSSSGLNNLLDIVDGLNLENEEEEEYINQMSNLFYKSVVERLKDKKIFKNKQQFLDVLKTLQEKNIRIGTMKQVDKSIEEFLRTVEERSQTSNPVQKPAIFYAGRLAMVIERENTVETAKAFIRQNKDDFKGNVLFYNWLEQ
ncbi:helix-turn-helix domain-containing protein [Bacillus cereus group sp. Bc252]|uniref:helix-turn-helix domain-containing protein n=1 Tax=Bacillus cereus group sp. Bc252 TaxID=3018104 RepID=UPI0022E0C715|nr:helix-turn-helix domain-containing protein [Bacillus cereus group sp. Bc252]MDA2163839.1 helix-turn-helix domain-containing protein [Bacillus cereus group sp. Bc252]